MANLEVTTAQLDNCARAYDENENPYYRVISSRNDCEYDVKAILINGKYVITCNCKAGQNGTPCWHKRAAIEAARLFKIKADKWRLQYLAEKEGRHVLPTEAQMDACYADYERELAAK